MDHGSDASTHPQPGSDDQTDHGSDASTHPQPGSDDHMDHGSDDHMDGCPSFNHNEHGCNADASCWYDHTTQMCHGHAAHAGCPSFNHNEHGCNADASCWYDHTTQM